MPDHKLTRQQYDMLTDEQYARHRAALIPHAIKEADRSVSPKRGDYAQAWNRAFFAAMDRLARDRGIVRGADA